MGGGTQLLDSGKCRGTVCVSCGPPSVEVTLLQVKWGTLLRARQSPDRYIRLPKIRHLALLPRPANHWSGQYRVCQLSGETKKKPGVRLRTDKLAPSRVGGTAMWAGIAEKRRHSLGAFQPPSVNWSRGLRPLMGPPPSRSLTQARQPPSVATGHDGLDFFHTHAFA